MSDGPLIELVRQLSPQRRKLLASLLAPAPEPIAVVGLDCRFPGAESPAEYWELLRSSSDAITEVPADRWDADSVFDATPQTPGKTNSRWGGFLRDVDKFDAKFFGISPRAAATMDPQQRILLEVAWNAFESAGQTLKTLAGSRTGVFVGAGSNEYMLLQSRAPEALDMHMGTGLSNAMLAGRLSYWLNLNGPSMVVDTACSSSLLAVHLAVQSLRRQESELAIAAGVNLVLTPWLSILASQMGATAADGRCKSFDARADGYTRGEGCGAVVLKRLSDAERDGDPIFAVIRGSAANQDGKSASLTAPSQLAQVAVIESALKDAGIEATAVDYVEAHGTGTALGDPIEIQALAAAYKRSSPSSRPLLVGSVKTNIGHLEAAAGVAGLIKAVLCLQNETLIPNLHFQKANPQMELDNTSIAVATELRAWKGPGRACGVSSFGWSGTNVHVVVEMATQVPPAVDGEESAPLVLPISADSREGLRTRIEAFAKLLADTPATNLASLCYTAAVRRTHHRYRGGAVGMSATELTEDLAAKTHEAAGRGDGRIVFVYSGHGSQWARMGADLYAHEPVYRRFIDRCDAWVRAEGWSVVDELSKSKESSKLEQRTGLQFTQPMLFVVQAALTELWRSWGVVPHAVIGQSVGEIAAAYASNALTLEQALEVVTVRARHLEAVTVDGGMLLVGLTPDAVAPYLREHEGQVSLAAITGPRTLIVSGSHAALQKISQALTTTDVWHRALHVVGAGHSPQVDPALPLIRRDLASLKPSRPDVPFYSAMTGGELGGAVALDAAYWAKSLRSEVRLWPAFKELVRVEQTRCFLEVSPHPLLSVSLREGLASLEVEGTLVSSLRRTTSGPTSMRRSLVDLYGEGANVDWRALMTNRQACASLPAHPYQRKRYWAQDHDGAQSRAHVPQGRRTLASDAQETGADEAHFLTEVASALPTVSAQALDAERSFIVVASGENSLEGPLAAFFRERHKRFRTFSKQRLQASGELANIVHEVVREAGQGQVDIVYLLDPPSHQANEYHELVLASRLASELGGLLVGVPLVTTFVDHAQDQSVAGAPLERVSATFSGLHRTMRHELPALRFRRIELRDQVSLSLLAAELFRTDFEPEIVLAGGVASGRRLERTSLPQANVALRHDSTVLITGGLGGLGLVTAEWAARRGAKSIVLVSRGRTSADESGLAAIRAAGAEVRVENVDVSDQAAVAEMFKRLSSCASPIRGIVHAAAVLDDGLLTDMSMDRFCKVARPKVDGAWNLHSQSLGLELDFFILYSSMASLLGSPGQSNYSAANGFLDRLAQYRRGLGLPALSVQWGPWAEVGGAAIEGRSDRLARLGFPALRNADAIDGLERALSSGATTLAITGFDWQTLRRVQPALRLDPVFVAFEAAAGAEGRSVASWRAELEAAAPTLRHELLCRRLQRAFGGVLNVPPMSIALDVYVLSMGLDSLTLLEVKASIEANLAVGVGGQALLTHPTVRQLATELLRLVDATR